MIEFSQVLHDGINELTPRIKSLDASNVAVFKDMLRERIKDKRIAKYYRRTPIVIPPPVDTDLFCLETEREDFYVCAGRFVPFKRIDLVAQAFTSMPDKRLILMGDGPEMAKIRSKAGPNVTFTAFASMFTPRKMLERAFSENSNSLDIYFSLINYF
jgi:glycosyltransferase involved in cell wall biosynthesis